MPEKFDPTKFKSYEELPEERKPQFKPVEGGFVDKDAIENIEEAREEVNRHREQKLIWQRPTQEEINKIRNSIEVNTLTGSTKIRGAERIADIKKISEVIKNSGTNRLVDLGCGERNPRFTIGRGYPDDEPAKDLMAIGVKEYIGVDMGERDTDWEEVTDDKNHKKISLKIINGEALEYLNSLPDNYANLWMMGIQRGNVISGNIHDWAIAILREMKRVVPKDGFMITDETIVNELSKICEAKPLRLLSDKFAKYFGQTYSIPPKDKKYEVKKGDHFYRNFRYVFDEPKLGLKIYVKDFPVDLGELVVIVNTEKILDEKENNQK